VKNLQMPNFFFQIHPSNVASLLSGWK